jgi:3-deoxy-7-phosphoheptulonate synthase
MIPLDLLRGFFISSTDARFGGTLQKGEKMTVQTADKEMNSSNYKLVSREYRVEDSIIDIKGVKIGGSRALIIAGPCSVESEEQIIETALLVKKHGAHLLRGGAFKPRTSPYSFQGLGEKGLKLLRKAGDESGLPVVTEVMDTSDVSLVAEYADVLQIGSRNMQNFRLLKTVGKLTKPVLLKRGMAATLTEFLMSAEYILSEGNERVILCERGIRTFTDHTRNTLDLNLIPAVKALSHLPIIVDPSHGTGRREFIEPMTLAALAAGADGVMIEVHPRPDDARSDANQTIGPRQFARLMHKIHHFSEWQRAYAEAPHPY